MREVRAMMASETTDGLEERRRRDSPMRMSSQMDHKCDTSEWNDAMRLTLWIVEIT